MDTYRHKLLQICQLFADIRPINFRSPNRKAPKLGIQASVTIHVVSQVSALHVK